MAYWLMKSEPNVYSIEDLERDGAEIWDGVRNYQARNFLASMALGDRAFFYHSNTKPPGIVGLMEVVEINVVDPTQFDLASKYHDPKSSKEKPRWHTVTVGHLETFKTAISLEELRKMFSPEELWVVRPGNRLSVMSVDDTVAEKLLCKLRSA
ncbi:MULTISPECIES: EVE domain-containing protein [Cyanophyceae]|uniref:EVE domain-containing protein n=1 Tax=Cyanophyceae TaxID=3028117 RepID=UPI00168840B7|nr:MULTISPECIES: EVE domain-containing protein [unclassified Phormidium]MBD1915994.1 EVE domain-containing protein [Phormidium sp. FACHB-77]MBD2031737.1 EVE domain-containing protein [Phormidium sp. FACHB-322]MBD2052636.1 EVE domain-containing protein [Leptolyngbya sp. FACHB-60]